MGTKNQPGAFDCYRNAYLDEPMFILLARDASAADGVRDWARRRREAIEAGVKPESDMAMVTEAFACADAMEAWRAANWPAAKERVETAADRHDRVVSEILGIFDSLSVAGVETEEQFPFLESVVVMFFYTRINLGFDSKIINLFSEEVRKRLAQLRLADQAPAGSA